MLDVSGYATLSIDTMELLSRRNGVEPDLLAVFRDEMLELSAFDDAEDSGSDDVDEAGEADEWSVELRGPADINAMRLDAMGIDGHSVRNRLDAHFSPEKLHPPVPGGPAGRMAHWGRAGVRGTQLHDGR